MKRAIIDCDYVINKLDEKNLNAWLFRATGYHGLGITTEYEKSIVEAKKNHPKRLQYINEVVQLILSESGTLALDTVDADEVDQCVDQVILTEQ